MKKNLLWSLVALFAMTLAFTACSDDDDSTPTTPATLSIDVPIGLEDVSIDNAQAVLTNVQTNQQTTVTGFTVNDGKIQATVPSIEEGSYNVAFTGHMKFTKNGVAGETDINETSENVSLSSSASAVQLAINNFKADGGFVISEIFFTGTQTSEGKSYSQDQYIILSNNSNATLYADSIAILESTFLTTDKQDYTPNIMQDSMAVEAIYMIPGTGKSVPVAPGKSLVLALNAKNHKEINTNSIDLSNADYEFYDVSSSASNVDEDNPNVPNLDKWYCYTASYFMLHARGFHAYAIAKMKDTKEDYLKNYQYDYSYLFTFGSFSKTMNKSTYKVPNSWILDAVNLSIESMYQWQVTAATLDAGWAHCGSVDRDANRFGKAVVRKKTADGLWVDTNNSTNDFDSDATPTLFK